MWATLVPTGASLSVKTSVTEPNPGPIPQGTTASITVLPGSVSNAATNAGFTVEYDFANNGQIDQVDTGVHYADTVSIPIQYIQDHGTYTISGFVIDKNGGATPFSTTLVVSPVPEQLSVQGASSVPEGSTYTLSLNATHPAPESVQTWVVNWDDGTVQTVHGTAQTLTHVYATPGAYTIGLTAIDQDGPTTASKPITVTDVTPILALTQPMRIDEGGIGTLAGTITSPGLNNTYTLDVNWGDGTTQDITLSQGATTFDIGHTYVDNPPGQPIGSYPISATVADQLGATSVPVTTSEEVDNVAPTVASLGFTTGSIVEGGTVTLVGLVTDPGINDTESVLVNWGDSSASAATVNQTTRQFTASHLYLDNPTGEPDGSYTVTAVATDNSTPRAPLPRPPSRSPTSRRCSPRWQSSTTRARR